MLLAICFLIAVRGAVDAVGVKGLGLAGYALAVVTGSVVGGGCVWVQSRLARTVEAITSRADQGSAQRRWFTALYLCWAFWILVAAVLGKWLTSTVIRLVGS